MKIILAASSMFDAWTSHCDSFDFVRIHPGSVFDQPTDAIVATTYAFGGIDYAYQERFGEHIEARLRQTIHEDFDDEILVGQAVLLPTKDQTIPFLIAAPVMRVPACLPPDTVNPYLAARAAILCALRANKIIQEYRGDPHARQILTISFTGVGGIDPGMCAHQVKAAIRDTLVQNPGLPENHLEAASRHNQLLQFGGERCRHSV